MAMWLQVEAWLRGWAIDRERQIFLFRIKNVDPREPSLHFLLSIEGELVIFEINKAQATDVTATIRFIDESLRNRVPEVQKLFEEGFRAGAEEFVGFFWKFGEINVAFAQDGQGT